MKIGDPRDGKVPTWLWFMGFVPMLWMALGRELGVERGPLVTIGALLLVGWILWVMRKKRGL